MRQSHPNLANLAARESRFSFWALAAFLAVLWVAGGASYPDVMGQPLTRAAAWLALIAAILVCPRPDFRAAPTVSVLAGLTVALVAIQLVPLPPGIWMNLPGRALFERAAEVMELPQPWRPLSVAPAGTWNALGSLIVPVVVLILMLGIGRRHNWQIMEWLLALVVAGCLLGALQFSGSTFQNPLINDLPSIVSANFANKNHFALFVAIGSVLAMVWGFRGSRQPRWKKVTALALIPLFILVILATGSRMGMLTGAVGIALGVFAVRRELGEELSRMPRRVSIGLVVAAVVSIVAIIALSITLGRAYSIERSSVAGLADAPRLEAWPLIVEAVGKYFPVGSGFGTFDPVYRIDEPDVVLRQRYFNEAHNDWLQILLEGGILGAALMVWALVWWVRASFRAWFGSRAGNALAQVGSAAILLIFLASAVDYPARTPMIMAMLVIFGVWLESGTRSANDQRAD